MSDQAKARRHAHRNTSRTAAVRRVLSGKPKTTHLKDADLFRKLVQAEAKLIKACWQDATLYSKAQIAAMYPDGYEMPVRWPGFTEWVRHL